MRFIILCAFVAVVFGCGKDDKPNPNPFNNQTNNENNQMDMGGDADSGMGDVGSDGTEDMPIEEDMGPSCDTIQCDPGFECVNAECVLTDSCLAATDLGELSDGATLTAMGNLALDGVDAHTSECNATGTRERVYQFSVAESMEVTFTADWQGQFDGIVDIRTDCTDATTSEVCSDIENGSIVLAPGTYFVFLEVKFGNAGDYQLDLMGSAATCVPGTRVCNGDDVDVCTGPTTLETYACGDSCSANECDGKTCLAPITVVAPGGLYFGDAGGYEASLNFVNNGTCGSQNTPGYEVVFFLPGLTANDIVSIGTKGESAADPDNNINAIMITEACGDAEACVASFIGYEGAQSFGDTVDWVVPTAGDYHVIIENTVAGTTPFRYKVEIIDL